MTRAAIRAMKGGDTLPAPWQPDQWLGFGKVDWSMPVCTTYRAPVVKTEQDTE